jgi:hypothetical protein
MIKDWVNIVRKCYVITREGQYGTEIYSELPDTYEFVSIGPSLKRRKAEPVRFDSEEEACRNFFGTNSQYNKEDYKIRQATNSFMLEIEEDENKEESE